ncbi:hypothetical protein [Gloeothece verrucosa]|uniref:Uncharacterized protein n=1 Tax=Gloeothece verrucosa (strain PCC 7822) TaxID=497965 RepID=E0UEQ5_GLOV7|nr:hypothetical protein [Gloeothece verrucosa]ADN16623.1 hypothetical protein Cyan7822_4719 [Gloeothece verrucosa PCC 7822]
MKFSKTNSSSYRYFLAGLQPFGKLIFWGPLAVVGLLCFGVWQYNSNPEWLSRFEEQPPTLEDSWAESQIDFTTPPQSQTPSSVEQLDEKNLESSDPKTLTRNTDLPYYLLPNKNSTNRQATGESSAANKNSPQKSSLFDPMIPEAKSNGISLGDSPIVPVKPSPMVIENHLQQALNQQSQSNPPLNNSNLNSANSSAGLPQSNSNNSAYSSNATSNTTSFNSSRVLPQNNSLAQPVQPSSQPYQAPYNNYNYSTQPQPQQQLQPTTPQNNSFQAPYQAPYNNYNYSTQPQQQLQSTPPQANSFKVPYNNYPTQSQTSNVSGQFNQTIPQGNSVPANPYSPAPAQIQPSVQEYSNH